MRCDCRKCINYGRLTKDDLDDREEWMSLREEYNVPKGKKIKNRVVGECYGDFFSDTFNGHLILDHTHCTCYHFEKRPHFKKQSPEEQKKTDDFVESVISATVGALLVEEGIIPKSIIDRAYGTH